MVDHTEILAAAAKTLRDRGHQYGAVEACFDRASRLASIRLDKPVNMFEVAVIMSCVKQARQIANPTLADSWVDGINYDAIAAQFAPTFFSNDELESDIAAMARRFAPRRENNNAENHSSSHGNGSSPDKPDAPTGG
jgi:hypothetical protein